jgi:carbon monoxide dehydrogenase subunit G
MARFEASFHEEFTVRAEPAAVLAQFLDLDQIIAHYGDLETAERLDDETLQFLLKNQNHGVFSFQGRYVCRYRRDGDAATAWASEGEGGNVFTSGRATVAPGAEPGTTRFDYRADMALEIDVNKMLAPVLDGIVKAAITQQMRAYVKRMIAAVEAR